MIEIESVEAWDTFSYRHLRFDFRTGLHSIEGVNGSSKTSIFLALIHCLMNKNPKGCKVDDVSNKISGEPYCIEVVVWKDNIQYRFVNSKKTGQVRIAQGFTDISLKRIPDNLKLIQEILGADYTLLCDLIYQSKDSTLDLLETGTDRGRKVFINRILKLAEIDEQAARMKDKEKELSGKNGRISFLEKQIETLRGSLTEPLEVGEEIETQEMESKIRTLSEEIDGLTDYKKNLKLDLQRIADEIATAQSEVAIRQEIAEREASPLYNVSLSAPAEEVQKELERMVSDHSAAYTNLVVLRMQISRAEESVERFKELKRLCSELQSLPAPEKSKEVCQDQLVKIQNATASLKTKQEEVAKKLTYYRKAVEDRVCPTCGSSEHWEKIQAQITELEGEWQENETLLAKCAAGQKKYTERLEQWGRREKLEAKIEKLSESKEPMLDLDVAQERVASMEKRLAEQDEQITAVRNQLSDFYKGQVLRNSVMELRASLKGVELSEELASCYQVAQAELDSVQLRLQGKAAMLADLNGQYQDVVNHNAAVHARREINVRIETGNAQTQQQITQAKEELAASEKKLDLVREWNGILGDKGFRVSRINRFLHALNATMVKYSRMICDGRIRAHFFINPDGEVEFNISDAAKEMDYPLWSGGEKARVRLVCLFAVLELLEVMGSVSFNVLCLDEVFDQLDADGKEGLFRVLEYLKGRGKAIYVIAHSELALDLSYDSIIKAVKHEDGTTEITC